MLLFAKFLKNPHQPIVEDAAIWVQDDSISYAGQAAGLPSKAHQEKNRLHLKNFAIFPGLVNAHCHLELTLAKPLPYPGSFTEWIRVLLETKNNFSPETWRKNIQRGIQQNLEAGVTTLGDHASFNSDFEALLQMPFRGRIFLENLGVIPEIAESIYHQTQRLAQEYEKNTSLLTFNPSPHSVHALDPLVLKNFKDQNHKLLSIHLLESAAERDYFEKNAGELFQFIVERGVHPTPSHSSPIATLAELGILDHPLMAIHLNYINDVDLALLAQKSIPVIHCPLSHEYFHHDPFPLEKLTKQKITLGLGTDSLASSRNLSMLEVLRSMKEKYPALSEEDIFIMATKNGAKALQMETEIGSLEAGKKADLIGVPVDDSQDPMQSLFQSQSVDFSMINGKILLPPLASI